MPKPAIYDSLQDRENVIRDVDGKLTFLSVGKARDNSSALCGYDGALRTEEGTRDFMQAHTSQDLSGWSHEDMLEALRAKQGGSLEFPVLDTTVPTRPVVVWTVRLAEEADGYFRRESTVTTEDVPDVGEAFALPPKRGKRREATTG